MICTERLRHRIWYLLPLVLALLMTACKKSEPIRIGFVDGLSGAAADLGQSSRDGALLAVENRNAAGGIHGRKIELVIKDDAHNPDTAQKVVRELIGEGVVAIIGHGTSNTTVATAPIANAAKTVMISHTATSKDLTGKYEHFFRVVNTTEKYATKNALFRRHVLKEKRIVIAYDTRNLAYTESWLNDFRKAFEREGGTVVALIPFDSGATPPMERIAEQLLRNKPDGVLLIACSTCIAELSRQIRTRNHTVNIGSSEWGATEKLLELGGKAVEGIYSSQFIDRNSKKPDYLAFREEYQQRFGRAPGFGGVMAYDATNVILTALEKNADRENLGKTIMSIGSFPGLQTPVRFHATRDVDRPSYITTILNGRFHTYED